MSGAVARGFHDATKHTWRSVRLAPSRLDWDNRPAPFKRYRDVPAVGLPVEVGESGRPAAEVLSGVPADPQPHLDLPWLAGLLFFSAGVTRRWRRGGRTVHFRAAPSAGALYPVEAYVVCAALAGGLDAGVYHFDPDGFRLDRLRAGDWRDHLARVAATATVAEAPLSLVLTGIPFRTTWKYGSRGYRHLFWDAGTILAHALAVTEAAGAGARVLTGFADDGVARLLGLGHDELPLAVVPVGGPRGGSVASGAPAGAGRLPPEIDLDTEPVAPRPAVDERLQRVHRAGVLDDAEGVLAWRRLMGRLDFAPAATHVPPPAGAVGSLEDVVLRRGSTRRFAGTQVPRSALTWPLRVASRAVPGDLCAAGATLLVHDLVVHAVQGMRCGAYRWRGDAPELLRAGDFREEAATLCLEQALGGDGAYTAFHSVDLHRALRAGGARAYRAAQLEGGVAAGRLQLAAHALGVGGTGLTFYDDDVSAFFGTDREPVTVTALGMPAYRPRRGRRPGGDDRP